MISGDKILATCALGSQRKETEHIGMFVREKDDKFICYISGQEVALSAEQILKYDPIDQNELEAKCKQELPQLAETIKQACEKLLRPDQYGEIKVGNCRWFSDDGDETIIELLDGNVIVSPAPFRQRCIGRIRETAGWSVGVIKHYPGTRHEPPDWDVVDQGVRVGDLNVARLVVDTLFKICASDYFQLQQEDRLAQAQDWKEFE